MALWHLVRMETDFGSGTIALTCVPGENPIKFTLLDSTTGVYASTSTCVREDADGETILGILADAGYTPNDWT